LPINEETVERTSDFLEEKINRKEKNTNGRRQGHRFSNKEVNRKEKKEPAFFLREESLKGTKAGLLQTR